MIKAILFDLDGTLLDTLPDIAQSVNEMLRLHGYPAISEELTRAYIGNGARLSNAPCPQVRIPMRVFRRLRRSFRTIKGIKPSRLRG